MLCVCVCSALPLCCSNTDEVLNSIADRMQPLEKSLWCTGHDVAPQSARRGGRRKNGSVQRETREHPLLEEEAGGLEAALCV